MGGKMKKLTIEEVNSFQPSYENPLIVQACCSNVLPVFANIKIVTPVKNNKACIIDGDDNFYFFEDCERTFESYASKRQPEKYYFYIVRYKTDDSVGTYPYLLNSEGLKTNGLSVNEEVELLWTNAEEAFEENGSPY
jgi:hypothetical protein